METEFKDVETPEEFRRQRRRRILLVAGLVLALLLVLFLYGRSRLNAVQSEPNAPTGAALSGIPSPPEDFAGLSVWFIDVGQGDCALLRAPDGKTMLIDAGPAGSFGRIKRCLDLHGVKRIDMLVASHLHEDHIGSMADVVENYEIGAFYLPPFDIESSAYANLVAALDENHVPAAPVYASATSVLPWSDDPRMEVRVLAPYEVTYDDDNDTSIMLRIAIGQNAVLFTGDAGHVAERLALKALPDHYFRASVLKVAHHGSDSGTGDKLLKAVKPTAAVISVGANNTYGLPDESVVNRLSAAGARVFRTDESGTILFLLDETQTWVLE